MALSVGARWRALLEWLPAAAVAVQSLELRGVDATVGITARPGRISMHQQSHGCIRGDCKGGCAGGSRRHDSGCGDLSLCFVSFEAGRGREGSVVCAAASHVNIASIG